MCWNSIHMCLGIGVPEQLILIQFVYLFAELQHPIFTKA